MCGVYFSNAKESAKFDNNFLIRGPDHFNETEYDNISMCHSLLSLTGEFTPQPIEKNGVKLIFNGQIYNYDKKSFPSDSYFVLDEYLEKGLDFWKDLDGEYAIVIYDPNKNTVFFATDIFGTKPLFYSVDENIISISSLISTLEKNNHKKITKCAPNTIYTYDLTTHKLDIKDNYYQFNLNQYKNNFDDWTNKFIKSIEKRFGNMSHDIILPLSSGHDSGAIACAFDLLDIKYYSYSFFRNEHRKVLAKRLLRRMVSSPLKTRFKNDLQNEQLRSRVSAYIKQNTDQFFYGYDIDNLTIDGTDDPGSIGLSFILGKTKKINSNIKIVASGQGGDEIYSNNQTYTFDTPNPKKFTNDLDKIFPWQNFFYGTQISYLGKEESIGGSYGLETRYPFLDRDLVQEYLNLKPELKNKFYKSPISHFLRSNKYPYRTDETKTGFNP